MEEKKYLKLLRKISASKVLGRGNFKKLENNSAENFASALLPGDQIIFDATDMRNMASEGLLIQWTPNGIEFYIY